MSVPPLLFIIIIDNIVFLLLTGMLYLFAGDMTLVVKAKTELNEKPNSDLKKIGQWLKKSFSFKL